METLLRLTVIFVLLSIQITAFGQVGTDLRTFQEPLPCIDKRLTVVAHMVRDSFGNTNITEAEIEAAFLDLNTRFEPICVSFEVCEFRIIDNFQYDILENNDWDEMQVKYHVANRINMFFVQDFDDDNNICGFAGLGQIATLNTGGIVIKKGNCLSSIPHEMGHYFGLLHTFEGSGDELVDGSNCETAGDQICDTPADPYVVNDPIANYVDLDNGCRFINGKVDANGQFYSPHVGNTMSYYPGECDCGFTYGQYLRMATNFLNSSPKMW